MPKKNARIIGKGLNLGFVKKNLSLGKKLRGLHGKRRPGFWKKNLSSGKTEVFVVKKILGFGEKKT